MKLIPGLVAGFLVGGRGTCPLVDEAESCPSGRWALSLGVITGGCVPGRTLGRLFADECGSVPTLFLFGLGLLSPDGLSWIFPK